MNKRSVQFSLIVGLGCAANLAFAQTPETPAPSTTPTTPAVATPDTATPDTANPSGAVTDTAAPDVATPGAATAPTQGDTPTTPDTTPNPTAGETPQNAASYGYGLGPDRLTPPKVETPAGVKAPSFQFGDGWKVKMSGQYRPRVWTSTHKIRDLSTDELSWLINQRARLGVAMVQEDGMEFFFQMQDVRAWGEEANTLNTFSAAGLDAHQAYGNFPITDEFNLKIGRQEIVLDNSRLVGNVGWTQRARSFDAGRAIYKLDTFTIQALYAKVRENNVGYPDGHVVPAPDDGKVDFAGAQASLNFAKGKGGNGSRIAALYLANIKSQTKSPTDPTIENVANQSRQTIGGIVNGKYSGFSYSGEGYYQFGKQSYNAGTEAAPDIMRDEAIGAFLAAGRAGYTANVAFKPGITAWGEYLSGSDEGKPTGVFDTLYATNHKFYGFMDMFLSIPGNTKNLGLFDMGGRLQFGPIENFWGQVDFHHFRTAKAVPVGKERAGDQTLGNEIDFVLNYRFTKQLTLQGVWTVFMPEGAMGYVTGAALDADLKTQQLGYFTLDFKI